MVQAVFQPRLVEKGHIQGAGVVHRPELHQIQPLADVGDGGRGRHHGGHAGGLTGHQVRDAAEGGAVVVGPGEVGDQVPQGGDAQLPQGLGPLLADAPDVAHVCVQVRHGITSRLANHWPPLYNGAREKTRRWVHGRMEEVGGLRDLVRAPVRRDDRGRNGPVAPGSGGSCRRRRGAGPVEPTICNGVCV
ncbi:RNA polymerase sigma factor, partial [Dysosmobacter welbionis]